MPDQDTSIFNQGQSQATPANQNTNGGVPPAQASDDLSTLLGAIRNERGEQKYRTVQDALNALKHSQEYIPELSSRLTQQEQQLKEAREAANKVAELERVVQALTQEKTQPETPSNPGLSEDQVAELVTRTLTKRQQEEIAKKNLSSVADTVKQAFGDKAEEMFYSKAQEMGMSKEQFNSLAASTPKAVLKLLGLEDKQQQAPSFVPSSSSVNSAGFEPNKQTFIGRNSKPTLVGATYADLREENNNAKRMVEELHAQGKSVHDLTSYAEYVKHFKNK